MDSSFEFEYNDTLNIVTYQPDGTTALYHSKTPSKLMGRSDTRIENATRQNGGESEEVGYIRYNLATKGELVILQPGSGRFSK